MCTSGSAVAAAPSFSALRRETRFVVCISTFPWWSVPLWYGQFRPIDPQARNGACANAIIVPISTNCDRQLRTPGYAIRALWAIGAAMTARPPIRIALNVALDGILAAPAVPLARAIANPAGDALHPLWLLPAGALTLLIAG